MRGAYPPFFSQVVGVLPPAPPGRAALLTRVLEGWLYPFVELDVKRSTLGGSSAPRATAPPSGRGPTGHCLRARGRTGRKPFGWVVFCRRPGSVGQRSISPSKRGKCCAIFSGGGKMLLETVARSATVSGSRRVEISSIRGLPEISPVFRVHFSSPVRGKCSRIFSQPRKSSWGPLRGASKPSPGTVPEKCMRAQARELLCNFFSACSWLCWT